jgi:chromosome segregation ATPase
MASKEEIERRVEDEAKAANGRWNGMTGMEGAVRPFVVRMIELEEENTELRERLDKLTMKLVNAETWAHNAERDERHRLTEKLSHAEARVIELDRQVQAINADRSAKMGDLTEARSDLRAIAREGAERMAQDARTITALRSQVATLQDAADRLPAVKLAAEKAVIEAERTIAALRRDGERAAQEVLRIQVTVDTLAVRMAELLRGGR